MNLQRRHIGHHRSARSASASAAASARARARRPAAATRGQASRAGWSCSPRCSKAARCRWFAAFPSAASTTRWAMTVAVVNVGDLDEPFNDGDEVTPSTLQGQRPGQGPVRRAEDPGRRRADQEAQGLGPPLQRVGRGEDREGRGRGDRACRAGRRSKTRRRQRSREKPSQKSVRRAVGTKPTRLAASH